MAREIEDPGALAGATGADNSSQDCHLDAGEATPTALDPQANRYRNPRQGEASDLYPHVVARLSDRWRVVRCSAGLQWILQKRGAGTSRTDGWRGVSYCVTKKALIPLCVASCGLIDPLAMAVLVALPAHIGEMPK